MNTIKATDDIEQFPACAICLEENIEDPGGHWDGAGHAPVALPTYTTRHEAIIREIIEPLETHHTAIGEFDLEAIAAIVLSDHEHGYRRTVGHDQFWQTVGANVLEELPVFHDSDPGDEWLHIGAKVSEEAAASVSMPAVPDDQLWNALAAQRLQAAGWTITAVTTQGAPATVRRDTD